MAVIETWFNQDLQQPVKVHYLDGSMFSHNGNGNRIGVHVFNNGEPVTLSGTVSGYVVTADGSTVPCTGTRSGNRASILIPAAAYQPGAIFITVFLTDGSTVTTLASVATNVLQARTGNQVSPGSVVTDWTNTINAAVTNLESNFATATANLGAIVATPYASLTFPVALGKYTYYNNNLYRCTTPITTSEDFTPAHWTAVKLGDDVSDLKSATDANFSEIEQVYGVNIFNPFALEKNKAIRTTDGEEVDSSQFDLTDFIDVQDVNSITFKIFSYTGSPKFYVCYYSSNQASGFIRRVSNASYITGRTMLFDDGTKYIRIVVDNSNNPTGTIDPFSVVVEKGERTISEYVPYYTAYDRVARNDVSAAVHFVSNSRQYNSCDDVPAGVITFVSSNSGSPLIPDAPLIGTLISIGNSSRPVQYMISYENPSRILTRLKNSTWTAWESLESIHLLSSYSYTSCDDIDKNCILFISSSGGVLNIPDAPFVGYLQTLYTNANVACQIMYPWRNTDNIEYRSLNNGTWTAWRTIGGYDSNGWLQPVDTTDTSDETGKTDMTGAIMSMLTDTGYCHLAPGIYYVSGGIDLPENAMIEGCGKQTVIRLLQSTTSGYIIKISKRSTVKNICFSGNHSEIDISGTSIGGRIGISYSANASGTPVTKGKICLIEGCWFERLDSGFYGYDTGGASHEGIEMINCVFQNCKAGINFDYRIEYSKVTNCVTYQCHYGCINNGGNNVFMNCTFHGTIGFLLDNSASDKTNTGHGSVIGCTFNHIDNMNNPTELGKGIGIKVLNTQNGFLFANCQIWYGRIHIENSKGIQITGCEFGGIGGSSYPVIEASGTDMLFVDNSLFQTAPTFSITCPYKITNCWRYDGTAVT